MAVVYFDQLLDAGRTEKLVELLFSAVFNLTKRILDITNNTTAPWIEELFVKLFTNVFLISWTIKIRQIDKQTEENVNM